MESSCLRLPYQQTGSFSKIIIDYLRESPALKPFYQHPVNYDGVRAAMESRKRFPTDRKLLVTELRKQYENVSTHSRVLDNIDRLADQETFTICTAHQPSIFTGNLFFVYKIIHAIRVADDLNKRMANHFVPVFFMGSEDADLDELGSIYVDGNKISWDTKQTGAVGRMQTKGLETIIDRLEGEFGVLPFGKDLISLLRKCYLESDDVQSATFKLIDRLFAEYGLVVLIPDNANFKKQMYKIFEDDLFSQTPSAIVEQTTERLSRHYKVQANPRDINLFYLKDNIRDRITKHSSSYQIQNAEQNFSSEAIVEELKTNPDRFSPNVILRGLYQETILPNLVFIGGGGELAYWLELKALFEYYRVPFPVLLLRNSFLILEKRWGDQLGKLNLSVEDLFLPLNELVTRVVKKRSDRKLDLDAEKEKATALYQALCDVVDKIDKSLIQHIHALEARALNSLKELEKKMIRAEKRKFEDEQRQLEKIKNHLFPHNGLQERIENFMPYYSKWGPSFIQAIYQHSLALDQQFTVLIEN